MGGAVTLRIVWWTDGNPDVHVQVSRGGSNPTGPGGVGRQPVNWWRKRRQWGRMPRSRLVAGDGSSAMAELRTGY